MNHKRIMAVLSATACAASMLSAMPLNLAAEAAEMVSNDFEVTYGGWYAESDDWSAKLTAVEGIGYDGSRGMTITGRKDADDGACSEKDLYLVGGKRYDYSVRVFCETDQTFRLTILTKDKDTEEETIKELDSKFVKGGQWATLSASYTAPENSKEFKLTITTDSTADFVFDDVKITGKEGRELVAAAAELGIKDEIVNYGIRSGNIFNGTTIGNQTIKNMFIKDCNAIECENETKPDATLVQAGSTNTNINVRDSSFAKIADFCVEHGMGFRGHTLVWHSQTPLWFFKDNFQDGGQWVNSTVMNQRLKSYIDNMFAMYKNNYPTLNLYAYDVCNECISDSDARTRGAGGAREPGYNDGKSPWVQVYGDNSFIAKAFEYAHDAAPASCHLFYNDYNEYWDHKRDCIIKTCQPLLEKGWLQGIGMQSHIDNEVNSFSGTNNYLKAMDMYLNAGFEVQITELDISVKDNGDYGKQATKYKAILSHAMDWNASHPNGPKVTLFQVWGPDDGHSWLSAGSNGLLYNSSYQPKQAYDSVTSIIPKSEWGDGTQFAGGGDIVEPEPDENGYWLHATFESSTDGFSGRAGGETVATSSAEAYAGSKSLSVSGREAAWNGAKISLSSRTYKPGTKYSFSGNVMYTTGGSEEKFHFTMQYSIATSEDPVYVKIDTQTIPKGQWGQLANTSFEIPSGASDVIIYFETEEGSTVDFYVDEVIVAVDGTEINGAKPKKLQLGDVDCNEVINAKDLTALKRVIAGKWDDNIGKLAADVDQSGEVDATDAKLLMQFLTGQITKFPVAERPFKDLSAAFAGVTLGTSIKMDNENNPLTTQRFGADPGWLVWDGRLYVYTTNDALEYRNGSNQIQENTYNSGTINCVSSADLVNWTDHGPIPIADRNSRTQNGACKWANNAWAPDAAARVVKGKQKFFLYFADNASGIGVVSGDSPVGPFTDPIGGALINKNSPNCSNVEWMFDPGVYYDEATDEAYIFFGGGRKQGVDARQPKTGRCCKLSDDMISLDGTPVTMETPYLFEDSSLIKIGDTWYYSYCSNWDVGGGATINGVSFGNADILYMTSKNPLGPWGESNLAGNVFRNTGSQRIDGSAKLDNSGNNHHSIVYFKDQYYLLYHARKAELRMGIKAINSKNEIVDGGNYRSTQIDKVSYSNGKLSCVGSMKGVDQLETLNPYETQRAATMAQMAGIQINGYGANTTVTDIQAGDWIKVKGVEFSSGCKTFTARASSKNGAVIKAMDSDGNAFAYAEIPAGGSMTNVTSATLNVTGTTDVTFVFSGDVEFDSWSFS